MLAKLVFSRLHHFIKNGHLVTAVSQFGNYALTPKGEGLATVGILWWLRGFVLGRQFGVFTVVAGLNGFARFFRCDNIH